MDPAGLAILLKILNEIFFHEKERPGSKTIDPDPLTLNRQDPEHVHKILTSPPPVPRGSSMMSACGAAWLL